MAVVIRHGADLRSGLTLVKNGRALIEFRRAGCGARRERRSRVPARWRPRRWRHAYGAKPLSAGGTDRGPRTDEPDDNSQDAGRATCPLARHLDNFSEYMLLEAQTSTEYWLLR